MIVIAKAGRNGWTISCEDPGTGIITYTSVPGGLFLSDLDLKMVVGHRIGATDFTLEIERPTREGVQMWDGALPSMRSPR